MVVILLRSFTFSQYTTLLNFDGTSNGKNPYGNLITDGTFMYGMSALGGTNNLGTIFKIKNDGSNYVKLLDFDGSTNGRTPLGALYYDGTFLYGMNSFGGANNFGTIFKIKPDGTNYVKLLDFAGTLNGKSPNGSLISDGTFLYGMTKNGGTTNERGTIFKIMPNGTGYSKLLDFTGAANGSNPEGDLYYDGTFLYGMTRNGGTNNVGTVFKIMPNGTGYVKLLDFDGAIKGRYPEGSLYYDGTYLYGMTSSGGVNDLGVIFKIMPDGTGYVKLLDFNGSTNGRTPRGELISDGIFLYGMNSGGGPTNFGSIFKIKPDGTSFVKLSDFADISSGTNPQGSLSYDGTFLYGMTLWGGTNSLGAIFKYCITPLSITATNNGAYCEGADIQLSANGGDSYLWSGPLSYTSATQNPTITSSNTSMSGTYTVTATSSAGCSSSTSTVVTVNPLPAVTANSTVSSVCIGDSISLTGGGANTYSWTGGITNGVSFIPPIGTTTYTVTGTITGTGCQNTESINISVNALPVILANSTATIICEGESITLTGGGANSYSWTGGVTNGVSFIPPIGTTTYTVTGTVTGTGCQNTESINISVNALPVVSVNSTATIVCEGESITLTGGGANSYSWTGGVTNGVSFIPPTGITTFTVTGTETGTGCQNTESINISVNALPVVSANSTATIVCEGESITLTGGGANSYSWTGGVNNGVSFIPPAGTTTYMVTGTETATGCQNDASINISVNSLPVVSATNNGDASITASSGDSYLWIDCATGNTIPTQSDQIYTAATNGSYAVLVSLNSCSDTSDCIMINNVGVTKIKLDEVKLYPNPTTGILNVSISNIEAQSIIVTNILGEEILKSEIKTDTDNHFTIDITDKPAGLYLLNFGNTIARVIKQ
jgi:uncharacterized repeat protein (TIGR03803 family)